MENIAEYRPLIAQCIGFDAMAAAIVCFQQKERRRIMLWQLVCTALWSVHFFVLGNPTGGVVNAMQTLRCVIFFLKDNHRWAQSRLWPALFIALSGVAGVLTWQNAWSLLPLVGMVISTVALWMQEPKYIRRLTIPVSLSWLVYNAVNGSIAGVCNEIFATTSILIAMFRYDRKKKPTTESAVPGEAQTSQYNEGG